MYSIAVALALTIKQINMIKIYVSNVKPKR